jgi:hypothetical protein
MNSNNSDFNSPEEGQIERFWGDDLSKLNEEQKELVARLFRAVNQSSFNVKRWTTF